MSYVHLASGTIFTTISDVRQHSVTPLPELPTAAEFAEAGYIEVIEAPTQAPPGPPFIGPRYPQPTKAAGTIPVIEL